MTNDVSRKDIVEIKALLNMLIPREFSIGYIAKQTGRSRQAVIDYFTRNHEPDKDYFKRGNKIFVKKDAAMKYIVDRME